MDEVKNSEVKPSHEQFIAAGKLESSCSICNERTAVDKFPIVRRHKQWVIGSWCRSCCRIRGNESYYKHREARRNASKIKNSQSEFKEARKEYSKKYREKNHEKIKADKKLYYHENKEKITIRIKEYASKPEIKARRKEYVNEWSRKRRRENPQHAISGRLRHRVKEACKSQSTKKAHKTEVLIGCSISELKSHLEALFQPGMTWDNAGRHGWHIDHVLPCASFDLTDPEEQKKCFHWSNMQPLWSTDNLKKGAKIGIKI